MINTSGSGVVNTQTALFTNASTTGACVRSLHLTSGSPAYVQIQRNGVPLTGALALLDIAAGDVFTYTVGNSSGPWAFDFSLLLLGGTVVA